jgi:hypothetical protein
MTVNKPFAFAGYINGIGEVGSNELLQIKRILSKLQAS